MSENERDELGNLIRSAGRRPEIPADDLDAIKDAAETAWQDLVASERRRSIRRRTVYGLAAALVVVVLGTTLMLNEDSSPARQTVATVEVASGARVTLAGGDVLSAGDVLTTSDPGRLALRMVGGQSVRLDAGTRLVLHSETRLELVRGGVYVDSGPDVSADADFEILTPLGTVRELGTQYEVRFPVTADDVRVRVREGRISFRRNGAYHAAAEGEELTLARDGSVARAAIAIDGPEWEWVLDAAPPFEIEGRTLDAFLAWVARETGHEVRYADEALAGSAGSIPLHGTIEGLRPDESVQVVLEGSGLDYREEDGAIVVVRTPR